MSTEAIAIGGLAQQQDEVQPPVPGKLHLLSRIDRVRDAILGCTPHNWGFPVSFKGMEYAPYDSHQACACCGRTRLFNFKSMQPGPMFIVKRKVKL